MECNHPCNFSLSGPSLEFSTWWPQIPWCHPHMRHGVRYNYIQLTITNTYNHYYIICMMSWWRHQMETFSALLAICAGNSPVTGEFPTQRPVTRSFDVYFDMRPNERLSKQSWGWWFETLSSPLWRHRNGYATYIISKPWMMMMMTTTTMILARVRMMNDKIVVTVKPLI